MAGPAGVSMLRAWLRHLPGGPCQLCRQWSAAPLCTPCLQGHAAPRARCRRCAQGLPTALDADSLCASCMRQAPPMHRCIAALDYAWPWDGLLQAFKFGQRPELARLFAPLMREALRHAPQPELLLSVPLSLPRLRERGYNQSHELARRLAAARGLPYAPTLLARVRDPAPQSSLDRARREGNVRGAFLVEPAQAARLAGRRVALVDDVMTTGATLSELTRLLQRAGAIEVQAWVLMRA